jgi:preprotein translocase subunit SecG
VPPFAEINWIGSTLNGVLIVLSLILMFIVLIQRGKGGGLAGAFGGPGGSSAFGSRAGDAFTKITLYLAAIWVLVIMINIKVMQPKPAETPPPAQSVPGGGEQG